MAWGDALISYVYTAKILNISLKEVGVRTHKFNSTVSCRLQPTLFTVILLTAVFKYLNNYLLIHPCSMNSISKSYYC